MDNIWRRNYKDKLNQFYTDIMVCILLGRLKWIGYIRRMPSSIKVNHIFTAQPEGRKVKGKSRNSSSAGFGRFKILITAKTIKNYNYYHFITTFYTV